MSKLCMNSQMEALLGSGEPRVGAVDFAHIPAELIQELQSGIIEIQGCVVSATFKGRIDKAKDDETGVECFVSKSYMAIPEEAGDSLGSFLDLTKSGFAYAAKLEQTLRDSAIPGPFRIIVSSDRSEIPSCTVRFHRIRKDQSWLLNDLETYDQPVATIDF